MTCRLSKPNIEIKVLYFGHIVPIYGLETEKSKGIEWLIGIRRISYISKLYQIERKGFLYKTLGLIIYMFIHAHGGER